MALSEAVRRQTLLGNIANNLIAFGTQGRATSPADALMSARANQAQQRSLSLRDALSQRQEERLRMNQEMQQRLQRQEQARQAQLQQTLAQPQGASGADTRVQDLTRAGFLQEATQLQGLQPEALDPFAGLQKGYATYLRAHQIKQPTAESYTAWKRFEELGQQEGPKISDDYAWVDPLDPSKGVAPIKGSKEARAIEEAKSTSDVSKKSQAQIAQTVYEDFDRGLAIMRENGTLATGLIAVATEWIPVTPAGQLGQMLDSVKSNIGIDKLLAIKREGSGLGQVPQSQLEMLASVFGKMNANMDRELLEWNMLRAQEIYADIVIANGGEDPAQAYIKRKARLSGGAQDERHILDLLEKYR